MRGRLAFLLFAAGMFVGGFIAHVLEPRELRQLPVRVQCAPAVQAI